MKFICAFVISFVIFPKTVESKSLRAMSNLYTYLFKNASSIYNKSIRPVADQDDVLNMTADFYLNSIQDFNEKEGSITTTGFLGFYWNDSFLTWDKAQFDEIDAIPIPQNDIWKPDITLRNSYTTFTGLGNEYFNVWISDYGGVDWESYQVFKSTCDADVTYFPFDIQTCTMKFVAWSYSKEYVYIGAGSKGIVLDDYNENSIWKILSTDSDPQDNSADSVIVYKLVLQRKPLYYLVNIVVPTILLSILDMFTFFLPLTSGERASYCITVFLSFAVFNTIITTNLPVNSDAMSYMGIYLVTMNTLSTVVVVISLVELRLSTRSASTEPIGIVYNGVHRFVQIVRCKVRCTRAKKGKVGSTTTIIVTSRSNDPLTWEEVLESIDFLFFWLITLLTGLLTVAFLAVAATGAKITL